MGTVAANFLVSVVATGLAIATSRLINGSGGSGGTRQDPGTKLQFPPSTTNKVPVIYGSVFQKGIITDARISNGNQTMTYVLTLAEKTASGTFTVGNIFYNDQKLNFKTASGEQHIVLSSLDDANETNNNLAGLVRIRVYAGSTAASDQIFPTQGTGNTENARTALGESDTNYLLNGLIFAVIQIDYNSEKGTTGLPQFTFEIQNTLKNPGDVWYDYMINTRYGAGYPVNQINTVTSIGSTSTSLKSISDQIPTNQFESDGVTTSTQVRYEINGVLSTGDTIKANLDKINFASASWTTFDYNQGQWVVIPNRAATQGELDSAFVFNDDNILGDITISATNLEDLYNSVEIEYPSRKIRDQSDYYRDDIAAGERNDLEPDNTMNLRLELVNNALHAGRIGQIELKQSRIDKIISFRADYSAIQCVAGDVVKITTPAYGFVNKLFRLTKIREVEDEAGMLSVEITALEYLANVYADETLLDDPVAGISGISPINSSAALPAPGKPFISFSTATEAVPYFVLNSQLANTGYPVDNLTFYYSNTTTANFVLLTQVNPVAPNFYPNNTVTSVINYVPYGTWYFAAQTNLGSNHSAYSPVSDAFVWNPVPGTGGGGYWPEDPYNPYNQP